MDRPDDSAERSIAKSGEIAEAPDSITSVAVKDKDGEPVAVLEKWGPDTWFYAKVDALRPIN